MDNDLSNFEFNEEIESRCDAIASKSFGEIKRRVKLEKYRSIQYIEEETRDILLVCSDGSILYTPGELGSKMNIMAFENGIRSDPKALERLTETKTWNKVIV